MAVEDDRPIRKIEHEVGQDLSLLSVEEIGERIGLLRAEIERLEAARMSKTAARAGADSFFKF